jgi:PAS domain S-box-containing protein
MAGASGEARGVSMYIRARPYGMMWAASASQGMSAEDHNEKPTGEPGAGERGDQRAEAQPSGTAAEERFRTLVENLHVGVYRSLPDARGTILEANLATARLLGHESVELLMAGGAAATYEDPADREAMLAALRERGAVYRKQLRLRKADGTLIWVSCTVSAEFDAEGRISCVDGILEEVSEQRQAEEALRASEQEFRLLFENAGDAIFWADPSTGRIIRCNAGAVALLGRPRDEIVGLHQTMLHPPADAEHYARMFEEHLRRRRAVTTEAEVMSASGKRVPVHFSTTVTEVNGRLIVQGIFRDITERKAAEDALRESEEKYRLLVESAGEAIVTMDADGVYLFMNSMAAARLGGRPDDYVGKTMWDVFPRAIADRQAGSVRHVIRTGRGLLLEIDTVIQGQTLWYRTSVEPVRGADGTVRAALIIARDVSELKRAQQALEAAHRELIHAREAERQRLAGELHDSIGQELVALKLAAQAASSPHQTEAEAAGRLSDLGNRCGRLIKEVRGICHGLYPPTLESLGLVASLRQLGQCFEPKMRFALKWPPELADARFAPDSEIALFRIAQEAVNNILRHSGARNVQLELDRRDGWIHLSISDDGQGFDPAARAGRGMGLGTMRDRARAVGGSLEIASRAGLTRIDARVPAARDEAGTS